MENSENYNNGIDTRNEMSLNRNDKSSFLKKVVEEMRKLHKKFVEQNGSAPKFADVVVQFPDDDIICPLKSLIKLRDFDPTDTENDPDDDNVIFYANGIDELCEINTNRTADFVIINILEFCDSY